MTTKPAGNRQLMLKHRESLLVEISLLTNAESSHQLVNTLGLLALAGTDSLEIDVGRDMNQVTRTNKGTTAGCGLEEGGHHPGFAGPFAKTALEKHIELV